MATTPNNPMPRSSPPPTGENRRPKRSRIRIGVIVGVVAAVVAFSSTFGLRWRADRAYVGTTTSAELWWGECLNAIRWTDPANGAGWWAGHDIVVTGEYESEPVRVRPPRPDDPAAAPYRPVVHSSVGTIHFDSYDRATFTSRTGGTMALTRPPANMMYTADCVVGAMGGTTYEQPRRSSLVVWAEVSGVLGHPEPGGDLVLAKGVIHVVVDGNEVEVVPVDGRGPFVAKVPVGTVTLWGADDVGECGTVTVTVVAGDHVAADLLCERN